MKSRKVKPDVVILAGGSGTRLWPLSRGGLQKQFLPLPQNRSLISQAFKRARALTSPSRIWVVTNRNQLKQTRKELPALPRQNILAEPQARNTAAAVVWATVAIEARYGQPREVLVLPADQYIPDTEAFARQIEVGLKEAAKGRALITYGLKVQAPSTEYGYIEAREAKGACRNVKRFVEKPSLDRAKAFARSKSFFWNAGIFSWRSDFFLSELCAVAPKMYETFSPLLKEKVSKAKLESIYLKVKAISVDYAVMEKSKNVKVCPVGFLWSDLGTWPAVHQVLQSGSDSNVLPKGSLVFDGEKNFAHGMDKPVVLFGLKDMVLVETDSVILVTDLENAKKLRNLHEKLPSKLK